MSSLRDFNMEYSNHVTPFLTFFPDEACESQLCERHPHSGHGRSPAPPTLPHPLVAHTVYRFCRTTSSTSATSTRSSFSCCRWELRIPRWCAAAADADAAASSYQSTRSRSVATEGVLHAVVAGEGGGGRKGGSDWWVRGRGKGKAAGGLDGSGRGRGTIQTRTRSVGGKCHRLAGRPNQQGISIERNSGQTGSRRQQRRTKPNIDPRSQQ